MTIKPIARQPSIPLSFTMPAASLNLSEASASMGPPLSSAMRSSPSVEFSARSHSPFSAYVVKEVQMEKRVGNPLKSVTVCAKVLFERVANDRRHQFNHALKSWHFNKREKIGKGGYGTVFRAGRHVLKAQMMTDFESIEIEKDLLRKLSNKPHVPRLLGVASTYNREAFLLTDGGHNLHKSCKRDFFQKLDKISHIAEQILEYLAELHKTGWCHRDMKSENVVIDEWGHVRGIDLGLAAPMGTQSSLMSPQFRPPEVCLRMPITGAIDVWSLGVMLFELTAGGTAPFPHLHGHTPSFDSLREIMAQLQIQELPSDEMKQAYRARWNETPLQPSNSKVFPLPEKLHLSLQDGPKKEHFINFLMRCFEFDPKRRISVEEALKHPFFTAGEKGSYKVGITSNGAHEGISLEIKSGEKTLFKAHLEEAPICCHLPKSKKPYSLVYDHPDLGIYIEPFNPETTPNLTLDPLEILKKFPWYGYNSSEEEA